jgi:hypothetical protein
MQNTRNIRAVSVQRDYPDVMLGMMASAPALLDVMGKRSHAAARQLFAALRPIFPWAMDRGIIEHSPVIGLKGPKPLPSRERVLSTEEIRVFWAAADEFGWPFGPFFQLLLLTGQRREEVAGLRRTTERMVIFSKCSPLMTPALCKSAAVSMMAARSYAVTTGCTSRPFPTLCSHGCRRRIAVQNFIRAIALLYIFPLRNTFHFWRILCISPIQLKGAPRILGSASMTISTEWAF